VQRIALRLYPCYYDAITSRLESCWDRLEFWEYSVAQYLASYGVTRKLSLESILTFTFKIAQGSGQV
jgi:hypothetical protein